MRSLVPPLVTAVIVGAACATPRGGELEPRYVAVHNAFAAMGLAQVGPIEQGQLAEGREARVPLDLVAECATIVAIGGDGVRDLDATLLDPAGAPIAHDTTREPQAVLRTCLERAGTYVLVVKMAWGAGSFIATTWAGGVGASGGGAGGGSGSVGLTQSAQGQGTCEAPIALAAGRTNGTTSHGNNENEAKCSRSDSREIVYKLDVAQRQKVSIEVEAHFDSVLYVRKDDCTDPNAEVACNDDAPDRDRSRVDAVLEPGTYYVFVDGYGHDAGTFRLNVAMSDVPALAEVCRRARPLASGAPVTATTQGTVDNARAACGGGALGADVPFRLDVPVRSRVRVLEHSDDFAPVVHVRRACADEQSELACSDSGAGSGDATFVGLLDPGGYTVFADGRDADAAGRMTLLADTTPEAGTGVTGDACGDALPLGVNEHSVSGDTFLARDDVAGKCGGAGAPDVVYRVDLARRSHVTARFQDEEGHHAFVLQKTCGDRASEIVCGPAVDEVLAPGTYFLAVDGAAQPAFGRYDFAWRIRDVAGQDAACKAPPPLVEGRAATGTTAGGRDDFSASCAAADDLSGAPDRVFRLMLAARARVRLSLSTPGWNGLLAIRKTCPDVAGPSSAAAAARAELACERGEEDLHRTELESTLEPGTYYVLVDGLDSGSEGPFTLEYKVVH
jgi:hypothetical protein